MKKNLGKADRIIRILLAVVLAYLYFGGLVTGTWGVVMVVLGVVFVFTGIVSFCPIYALLGLHSNAKKMV